MIGIMVPYRPAGAAVILPYGAESRAVSETDTHSPAAPGEQTCLVQPLPSGVCVTMRGWAATVGLSSTRRLCAPHASGKGLSRGSRNTLYRTEDHSPTNDLLYRPRAANPSHLATQSRCIALNVAIRDSIFGKGCVDLGELIR